MNVKVTYKDPFDAVAVLVVKNASDATVQEGFLKVANEAGTVITSIPSSRVLLIEVVANEQG